MRRRDILILLGAVLMTSLRAASAKIWRIGFITALNGPGEDPKSQRRAVTERAASLIFATQSAAWLDRATSLNRAPSRCGRRCASPLP